VDKIAPHLREYWLIRGSDKFQSLPIGSREEVRAACTRYSKFYGDAFHIVHVTVLPKGSRAVVEAAKKLEATWGVKSPRGEARRAFRALQAAIRALEAK
jgi:hypothetical protein